MSEFKKLILYILHIFFSFNVIFAILEITDKRPQYCITSNMGWIVISALVYLMNKDTLEDK
jgi:hypothetical protein